MPKNHPERSRRRGRRRFDDELDDLTYPASYPSEANTDDTDTADDTADAPATGDRWSVWADSPPSARGPRPYPDWLVTEAAAVDTDLGLLKTGKEADVSLLRRGVPDTDRWCLLARKQYRSTQHRMFHRDAGYLEGRRMRESRNNRAMSRRTSYGRELIAGQWAGAEFAALKQLWEVSNSSGHPVVPYPVQTLGTELLMEFIGDPATGAGAPRLAQLRPTPEQAEDLWGQAVAAIAVLARCGLAHGDLSAYNVLVQDGYLILIDLPQVVDLIANPHGPGLLYRDVGNLAAWFGQHGVPGIDARQVTTSLLAEAGVR